MIKRMLNPSKNSSFFIFGARGTGKSTFAEQQWSERDKTFYIDLLDPATERTLQKNPENLTGILRENENKKWIFIDEVQKIPEILDVVHGLIEKTKHLFILSGSSARKLKKGAANLLAGRAFVYHLFPLTSAELGEKFELSNSLNWGTLPKTLSFNDADKLEYLDSYTNTYLKEEIAAEQIVRKLPPFRAFLEVAAQTSGTIINYSNIARDIGSDPVSVQSYFDILEDTLIGFHLRPMESSVRKRFRKNPKFYLFDTGVKKALERTLHLKYEKRTSGYGVLFEHFIINEIQRMSSYQKLKWNFSYVMTKDDVEIDLIIDRPGMPKALIEIKSTESIRETDIGSFIRLSKDFQNAESFCISNDPIARRIEHVRCLPWKMALKEIGLG